MKSMSTNFATRIFFFFLVILFLFAFYSTPDAKVTGLCSNCHTMHNSQQGTNVAKVDSQMGWNGSGQLSGGSDQGPQGHLLVSDCVGCHTSSTGNTIINTGGSKIPIVYNTGGYPAQPLAAGNFYYVAAGNNSYGHNVYGIAGIDPRLAKAPGRGLSCTGTGYANSCHVTLATNTNNGMNNGGCQGCHLNVFHHSSNPPYRYLSIDGVHVMAPSGSYVSGVEDPNWEQNPASGHNWYQGTTNTYKEGDWALSTTHSITAFCAGCHGAFHGPYATSLPGEGSGVYGMVDTNSIWIRHPTDVALPSTGEFSAYDPSASYNPAVPVAWTNVNTTTPSSSSGPVVMCLSCHRAHASQYPSMLRWDYNAMNAGGGGTGGCFVCHSQKN